MTRPADHARSRSRTLAPARPAPDGLAFYVPPEPLAAGPPGQVIWARPLTGAAALAGAAENLLVLYHSTALAGHDTAVSGTISIPPAGRPQAAGRCSAGRTARPESPTAARRPATRPAIPRISTTSSPMPC